jgi:hypothetical protein
MSNSQTNSIARLDLDRGGSTSTLFDIGKSNFYPGSWTPDDVVFGTYSHEGKIRIGALDLADPSSIQIVAEDEEVSSLAVVDASPDGRWLAWIGSGSGSEGAFISAVVQGSQGPTLAPDRQRIAVDSPSWVNWSRQGDELFVLSQGRTVYSVPVSTETEKLQLGNPQALFRTPSAPLLRSLSVSPDGTRFYFVIEPNASRRTLRVVLNWKSRLGGG